MKNQSLRQSCIKKIKNKELTKECQIKKLEQFFKKILKILKKKQI